MNTIKCKATHIEGAGCSACGGYGVILEKIRCGKCKRFGWTRPGCYTIYEGKHFVTVDGFEFIYASMDSPPICIHCFKGNP